MGSTGECGLACAVMRNTGRGGHQRHRRPPGAAARSGRPGPCRRRSERRGRSLRAASRSPRRPPRQALAAPETRCNRRRQAATGAVGRPAHDAGVDEGVNSGAVPEQVDDLPPLRMPALEQHRRAALPEPPHQALPRLGRPRDRPTADALGFGEVRRQQGRQREEPLQVLYGIGIEQRVAALRDHDRIEHDRRSHMSRGGRGGRRSPGGKQAGRDRVDDRAAGEHPDLHRVDARIGEDGIDLRRHEACRQGLNGGHAERVLRRNGRDRCHAVAAVGGEGLEIGLDPRPPTRIRTGDRQQTGQSGGPRKKRCRAGQRASAAAGSESRLQTLRRPVQIASSSRRIARLIPCATVNPASRRSSLARRNSTRNRSTARPAKTARAVRAGAFGERTAQHPPADPGDQESDGRLVELGRMHAHELVVRDSGGDRHAELRPQVAGGRRWQTVRKGDRPRADRSGARSRRRPGSSRSARRRSRARAPASRRPEAARTADAGAGSPRGPPQSPE